MPLPLTIWLYFLFCVAIFTCCCFFVGWIYRQNEKRKVEDLKREADQKYFEAKSKYW
jgi:molybdopterin synthase catalytic subunit